MQRFPRASKSRRARAVRPSLFRTNYVWSRVKDEFACDGRDESRHSGRKVPFCPSSGSLLSLVRRVGCRKGVGSFRPGARGSTSLLFRMRFRQPNWQWTHLRRARLRVETLAVGLSTDQSRSRPPLLRGGCRALALTRPNQTHQRRRSVCPLVFGGGVCGRAGPRSRRICTTKGSAVATAG